MSARFGRNQKQRIRIEIAQAKANISDAVRTARQHALSASTYLQQIVEHEQFMRHLVAQVGCHAVAVGGDPKDSDLTMRAGECQVQMALPPILT